MVGDSDQLPPVGAGNVLNDLLKTGLVPHVKLDKIFRQSRDSLIVTNAHEIVNGRYPNLDVKTSDFFFMRQRDASAAAFTVAELCAKRLPAAYGYSPFNDIQVLCPSRKGTYRNDKYKPHASGRAESSFGRKSGDKAAHLCPA